MTDYDRFLQEQREDEAYAADMYDAGYDDGFSGVNPRALDDDYKRGYDDGLLESCYLRGIIVETTQPEEAP